MYKVVCGMETKRRRVKWKRMSIWIGGEIKREKREKERARGGEPRQKGFGFVGWGSSFATMEGKHWWKERGRRDATIGEGFAW